MNTRWIAGLAMAAGVGGFAGQIGPAERSTTVCMANSPEIRKGPDLTMARMLAGRIFAQIGVHLDWQKPKNCPEGAIHVVWATKALANDHPGALAYAMPYENTRIVVFWNRVQSTVVAEQFAYLLAHVLAHEVGHILQGVIRHSREGIMKMRWTSPDYGAMRKGLLEFTSADVVLIKLGMEKRAGLLDGPAEEPVTVCAQ